MIAILIFCHKDFEQVRRLVDSLKHPDVDVFMHVDKKAEFDADLFKDVKIFDRRSDISWGNINNVKLDTLMLCLRDILNAQKYDRVVYMSGQDYLIKSIDEIVNYLNANKDKNYLSYGEVNQKHLDDRYLKYRFNNKLLDKLSVKFSRRKNLYGDLKAYWGPEWWMLNDKAIKILTDEYFNKYQSKLKNTLCMDEMIWQTILLNSPIKDTIVNDNKWYVSWKDHINGLNKGNPDILKESDFSDIINSGKFIARKFDEKIDIKILDLLDDYRSH